MHRTLFFIGHEIELPFNYKEKRFENEKRVDRFNVWFSDRTEPIYHSMMLGIQGPAGTTITLKYYFSNFHNTEFEVQKDGITSSKRTTLAINHVERHFHKKITEREVASICGMSVFTFSRIFHSEHNMTFREFLIQDRITQAKEFLRNPKITITDVAKLSGFTDTSSFYRLFHRYVGMAPSNYQKK